MKELTKEECEFIYQVMNLIAVQGVDANQMKVDVMRKMEVEEEINGSRKSITKRPERYPPDISG